MSQFDWNDEDGKRNTVVQSVEAVAVYVNPDGNIVIRQQSMMGDEDSFVVIPLSNAKAVAKAILAAAKG